MNRFTQKQHDTASIESRLNLARTQICELLLRFVRPAQAAEFLSSRIVCGAAAGRPIQDVVTSTLSGFHVPEGTLAHLHVGVAVAWFVGTSNGGSDWVSVAALLKRHGYDDAQIERASTYFGASSNNQLF